MENFIFCPVWHFSCRFYFREEKSTTLSGKAFEKSPIQSIYGNLQTLKILFRLTAQKMKFFIKYFTKFDQIRRNSMNTLCTFSFDRVFVMKIYGC